MGFGEEVSAKTKSLGDAAIPSTLPPKPTSWVRRALKIFGPGLVTGAADDDPSGIATYSSVGAQFGYTMLWTMPLIYPFMAGIQEISARLGRVTGRGVAGNIRQFYPAWMLYIIVASLSIANIINIGADIGAMGAAVNLLVGALNFMKIDPIKALVWAAIINGITAAPAMCFIMLLAGRRTVMGKLSLPAYLKILGWAATAIMAIAAVGMFLTSDNNLTLSRISTASIHQRENLTSAWACEIFGLAA